MKQILPLLLMHLLSLCYAPAGTKPNVLLICIDDLRPELKCFGKDYIVSPHIDELAGSGRAFHRHYVQAPTCGASRYTLLTGTYGPSKNNALFSRSENIEFPSFPAWFRSNGYQTVSVGKVSHNPGGRGGPDWNNPKLLEMPKSWDLHLNPSGPWQHPRGWMHGLANGEIRKNAKDMDLFQTFAGPDTSYPDGIMTRQALNQMEHLSKTENAKPFFLAVGILRPHLPFGAPKQYLDLYEDTKLPVIPHPAKPDWKSTWHGSNEFMKYNRWQRDPNTDPEFATEVRKHYAACVSYADAQVGRLIAKLDTLGLRDNTVVVLWGDHGWHLGERGIWGKHCLFEEALRSPLIISYPNIPHPGKPTVAIVETIDIYPTICDLAKLEKPDYLDGVSLLPILNNPEVAGHTAVSYAGSRNTIRTANHRLIVHKGFNELYEFKSDSGRRNMAKEKPGIVSSLSKMLNDKIR